MWYVRTSHRDGSPSQATTAVTPRAMTMKAPVIFPVVVAGIWSENLSECLDRSRTRRITAAMRNSVHAMTTAAGVIRRAGLSASQMRTTKQPHAIAPHGTAASQSPVALRAIATDARNARRGSRISGLPTQMESNARISTYALSERFEVIEGLVTAVAEVNRLAGSRSEFALLDRVRGSAERTFDGRARPTQGDQLLYAAVHSDRSGRRDPVGAKLLTGLIAQPRR